MAQMHFNSHGKTHSLRLRYLAENEVWEALVDVDDYFYFEASPEAEIWDLFSIAVTRYAEYTKAMETEHREWRKP